MSAELRGDQPRLADATQHHDGETIPADGAPSLRIQASDIYEWVAGRFFVVHTAYGRIGDADVGGIELIGYDAEPGGSVPASSTRRATSPGRIWRFMTVRGRGGASTHAPPGVLSDDGRAMPTLHEWSDDGVNWRPSMNVTLRKVV